MVSFEAVATTVGRSAMNSQPPGKPNLRQLLIDLQGSKGFHQVIISPGDESSIQLSYTWLGRYQHEDPAVFDKFMTQTGYELQAVYLMRNPINQYKIGCPHDA